MDRSKIWNTLILMPLLALSGCSLCREHPGPCAVGTAVLITSVALSAKGSNDDRKHDVVIIPVNCTNGACK
jgi:hypothetical protein